MRNCSLLALSLLLWIGVPVSAQEARFSKQYDACMNARDARNGVQSAMNDCAQKEYSRQDDRLNTLWKSVMQSRKPDQRTSLRLSQRRWIASRDKICKSEEEYMGSLDIMIYYNCMTSETIKRSKFLIAQ